VQLGGPPGYATAVRRRHGGRRPGLPRPLAVGLLAALGTAAGLTAGLAAETSIRQILATLAAAVLAGTLASTTLPMYDCKLQMPCAGPHEALQA
jgi:hypothetical protein